MTQGKPEPSDGSLRGPHSLLPPPEGVHRASGAHQGLKLEVKGTRPPLTSPLCPSPRPRPTCCGVLSTPRGGGRNYTRNHQIFGFSSMGPGQRYAMGTLDSLGLLTGRW